MKILFYSDSVSIPGGAEIYCTQVIEALCHKGMDVLKVNIDNKIKNIKKNINSKFERIVDDFKPDIIHINKNILYQHYINSFLKKKSIPIVTTIHDVYSEPFPITIKNRLKRILKYNNTASKKFIIPSKKYYQALIQNHIENIFYIPHFVDTNKWLFSPHPMQPEADLLFVGRVEKFKGVFFLLEVIKILKCKIPQIKLIIVGDGSQKYKLQQEIYKNSLNHNIKLVGYKKQSEILKYFHTSTIFLFPSIKYELFGLAGIEAQASGIPVIASNIGGVTDWCVDNFTGLLAPPSDPFAWSEKIISLLNDKERQEKLKKNARQNIEFHFNKEKSIEQLIELYQDILRTS